MASVAHDPGGRKRILLTNAEGRRKAIRLGKTSTKAAESFCGHVEQILASQIAAHALPRQTAAWLTDLPPVTREKLVTAGLCPKRQGSTKLGAFLDKYISDRPATKPNTLKGWRVSVRNLKAFFGPEKDIRSITVAAAASYERYLETTARRNRSGEHAKKTPLALATVRKRISLAKQFFAEAVDGELIEKNPFRKLKGTSPANQTRQSFITLDMTDKLVDACPDGQWRLIVALCRYGGMRCPSEVLGLQFDDVDWEHDRITVRSPKTEHHEGKDVRTMPLFPELRKPLLEAIEAAEPGTTHYITRYREASQNLRTTFQKIIERAKLKPWPKLFQNLRSSRQTELEEQFPTHVVCAWLGNSPTVARRHYLQVTPDHFERAAQNAARTMAVSDGLPQTVN